MCEYISSCIWFLLNAGRGGEYLSEPMRRRKPIFLPHTCLPSVIFNILPFISFHRAHSQTCVGLRFYLNYKLLKSISRHDFPPPLPVLSSFPSLKPLLLQPYGLPYKGLLHFDHTTPCLLPQGFSSNWECTFLYSFIFSNSGTSAQCSTPRPPVFTQNFIYYLSHGIQCNER